MRTVRRPLGAWAARGILGALLLLPGYAPTRLPAQQWRVAVSGGYEAVSDADDWSVVSGQLTSVTRRGNGAWAGAEQQGRFGVRDVMVRLGGVLHPSPRLWLTAEISSGVDPEFAPKNAWEVDVATLLSPRAGAGLGYRRQNYLAGAVDVVMPHLRVEIARTSWDARVFVSRNPSARTDVAFLLRITRPAGPRAAVWLGGGAGRESYMVGTPPAQMVRSLETVTGTAGARYNVGAGTTVRVDVTVVKSEPVLSRTGVTVGIERSL